MSYATEIRGPLVLGNKKLSQVSDDIIAPIGQHGLMPVNAATMSQTANRPKEEWGPTNCDRPHSKSRLA